MTWRGCAAVSVICVLKYILGGIDDEWVFAVLLRYSAGRMTLSRTGNARPRPPFHRRDIACAPVAGEPLADRPRRAHVRLLRLRREGLARRAGADARPARVLHHGPETLAAGGGRPAACLRARAAGPAPARPSAARPARLPLPRTARLLRTGRRLLPRQGSRHRPPDGESVRVERHGRRGRLEQR